MADTHPDKDSPQMKDLMDAFKTDEEGQLARLELDRISLASSYEETDRLKGELEQATLLTAALQELIDTEWRPIKNRLEDKVEKLQQDNERLKEELEHMTEHKKGHAITIRELQQEVGRLTAELEGYKDA